ncbi:hypothetical protein [Coleofasciculus sp. FACHB-542]|uniref:outer membrane protein n=1 Tax=Coleofasciculus sp. FACHB-542 TaxID=2692787 RepID=UPI0016820201|nr:hypothetical protein [Coleofasciculus sp. FACHB-542]MBD2084843.1 hypothetical protein [Coleofasciculus sp. FACHB-542]
MNTIFSKRVSFLLGLTALTVFSGGLSATAQSTATVIDQKTPAVIETSEPAASEAIAEPTVMGMPVVKPVVKSADVTPITQSTVPAAPQVPAALQAPVSTQYNLSQQPVILSEYQDATLVEESAKPVASEPSSLAAADDTATTQPFPGVTTSAAALAAPQQPTAETPNLPNDSEIAQTDIELGRATRAGRSYVGVGFNIGFGGDSALGDGSFAVISKIGLTNTLSVRPSVLLGDDTTFLLPVTYDFNIRQSDPFEPVRFAPYVGGGVTISTGDDSDIGFLVTGGVDVPLTRQFTANAALNIGFQSDEVPVGLILGVGYTFPGF